MALSQSAAIWLLIVAFPISVYVMISDLRSMRIPNLAVLALMLGFGIVGFFVFDLVQYLWQWTHFVVVLAVCVALYALKVLGAGDAKFTAAAAPFFMTADLGMVLFLFPACIFGGFFAHRIAKNSPLQRLAPEWESWKDKQRFPMGFPLGLTLIFYLAIAAFGSGA